MYFQINEIDIYLVHNLIKLLYIYTYTYVNIYAPIYNQNSKLELYPSIFTSI